LRKINIIILNIANIFWITRAVAVDDTPPVVYQPSYIYGETPAGVYMGDPMDMGMDDGMFMPNGEPMKEFNPQSGQPEQEFQFIQGQEALMADHSKTALKQYNQEQAIGNGMEHQYQQQIDAQTNQAPPPSIVLPSM
jgi:hypothetical protein